jgi:hypothetical protein
VRRYDELWRRANRPAERLLALGVPERDFQELLRCFHRVRASGLRGELSALLWLLGVGEKLGELRGGRNASPVLTEEP